jgi:hypothetical protein
MAIVMSNAALIGTQLGKHSFHLHAHDEHDASCSARRPPARN